MDRLVTEPNFFIVGAPKSATTNISYYLIQHPEIFMPEELEPYYFARHDVPKNYTREIISDKKKYLQIFKNNKNANFIGESSPVYLYCPQSAMDIKNQYPDAKIIISLRNPIEIVYSQYFSLKFMGFDNNSNFDAILKKDLERISKNEFFIDSILEAGFYSKHIKRFQNLFPENQIKIIIFEEYVKNSIQEISSILSFLGTKETVDFKDVPKNSFREPKNSFANAILKNSILRKTSRRFIPSVTRSKIGEKFLVKESSRPKLEQNLRIRLQKIYDEDVKELEILLNRKLPWNDFNDQR
tara:strand:- start:18219 stop:19112 length:894 start_codon:yes stop_codon:yes gene_type:complete